MVPYEHLHDFDHIRRLVGCQSTDCMVEHRVLSLFMFDSNTEEFEDNIDFVFYFGQHARGAEINCSHMYPGVPYVWCSLCHGDGVCYVAVHELVVEGGSHGAASGSCRRLGGERERVGEIHGCDVTAVGRRWGRREEDSVGDSLNGFSVAVGDG